MRKYSLVSLSRIRLSACITASLALAGIAHPGDIQAAGRPSGTVLPVTSCADDGGAGTLRTVVGGAGDGDTVDLSQLQCSSITLISGQIDVHVDSLSIVGPGQEALAISGNDNGRVFFHDGVGTLTLSQMTLRHGYARGDAEKPDVIRGGYGGCILSDHGADFPSHYGSVSLDHVTVTNCRAQAEYLRSVHGGAITAAGSVTLDHCTVSDNIATDLGGGPIGGGGGAIFARYGVITVRDSVISGNRAETMNNQIRGGGISAYAGATISRSVITGNFVGCDTETTSCVGIGGGIDVALPSNTFELDLSIVSNNVAAGTSNPAGGGVFAFGKAHISQTTISGNQVTGGMLREGGGLYFARNYGGVTIENSTISSNSASAGGGAFVGMFSTLTLVNSTVSANNASSSGGAIYNAAATRESAGPLAVRNSTITTNVCDGVPGGVPYGAAPGGGGIVDRHLADSGASDFQSSIIAGNTGATSTYDADLGGPSGLTIAGSNNLILSASGVVLPPGTLQVDPLLGPLQDNGGPTRTLALLAGSPAIDMGNEGAALQFDQRGAGYLRVSGRAADIGAYEMVQKSPDQLFGDGFDG